MMASSSSTTTTTAAGWSAQAATYASKQVMGVPDLAAAAALEFVPADVGSVLDVAAGPATLALQIATKLTAASGEGARGRIVVTDIAEGMIGAAKTRVDSARGEGAIAQGVQFEFTVAPAEAQPVSDHSVELVTCMLSLNLFPDRPASLREMRRALVTSGGRVLIGTWASAGMATCADEFGRFIGVPEGSEARGKALAMLAACSDPSELKGELEAAGFVDVAVVQREIPFEFAEHANFAAMLLSNPALGLFLQLPGVDAGANGGSLPPDELKAAWGRFLAPGGPGRHFIRHDEASGRDVLSLRWVLNIATGRVGVAA